jgi:hypothetical protein
VNLAYLSTLARWQHKQRFRVQRTMMMMSNGTGDGARDKTDAPSRNCSLGGAGDATARRMLSVTTQHVCALGLQFSGSFYHTVTTHRPDETHLLTEVRSLKVNAKTRAIHDIYLLFQYRLRTDRRPKQLIESYWANFILVRTGSRG